MKPTPLHILSSRIRRLSLAHQISHLRGLIVFEKPHSIRRGELESLLREKMTKQLRKESRVA